ncbi:MAG: ketoacyl-ACP synthase III [Gammaproteobacteria bacterium]|nr:MAG: ketoacyl-ACP synthase III [Gammaproteobacteria bacterium]
MALPERVLSNGELSAMVDTSDEWIRQRTGIVTRHIAGEGETTSTLSVQAAQAALEVADLDPARLDLIIVSTVTPDHIFPATACLVQDALGAEKAAAFDLSAGCSGFVYGLSMAADAIVAGSYQHALVIGAETLSRIIDWTDRGTCVLFGDGAGAVVLQASQTPGGVLSSVLGADGSGGELLHLPAGGSAHPASAETVITRQHFIRMQGREVFRFATRIMGEASRQVLDQAGLKVEDVALFVPHQANDRILQAAARGLGIPEARMFSNLARYGNTSAASIPIALCEAVEQGKVNRDDLIVCVGFGAGLTWAASAVRWSLPLPVPTPSRRMTFWRTLRYRWAQQRSRLRRLWRVLDARLFQILYERDGTRKRRDKDG